MIIIQNDPASRKPKMSRLLRIIIFIIIVLLLIFSGFRCSQTIPNGSKATANFIEKNQPEKENAPSIKNANSDEIVKNDANQLIKTTLAVDEATKNTEYSNDDQTAPDKSIEAKETPLKPAATGQIKPANKKGSDPTKENYETKESTKKKENTDEKTNTAAITAGSSIILKGVSFASGSEKLISSSITILNEVTKTLKEKSTLHIEIAGYTDNQGNAVANTKLSQLRADQVKAYLVTQDIQADRISSKGYGASSPIASNNTKTGREQNRRVEIHVK